MNLHHAYIEESEKNLNQWCLDFHSHPFCFLLLSCFNEHGIVSDISFSLQNKISIQIREGKKGNIFSYSLDSELSSFWEKHITDYLEQIQNKEFSIRMNSEHPDYLSLPVCQHDIVFRIQLTERANNIGTLITHCAARVLYSPQKNLSSSNINGLGIVEQSSFSFPFTLSHWEKELNTYACRHKLMEDLEKKLDKQKRLKV